jgi:predicted nucleic acid-binding protein
VPNQVFLDTGFIVALINTRDQYHGRAIEFAQLLERTPLITTEAVLLEIGTALSRGYKEQCLAAIDRLMNSEDSTVVRLDDELFERALDLYETHLDKDWGLVDCLSFIVMRDSDTDSALTFDHNFEQAGFKIVPS